MTGDDPATPILEVTGLSKNYGETRALADVSLAFRRGTIHAILGENGSGKSTTVKLFSGIVRPSAGSVRVNGQPVSRFNPAEMAALGVATVFQEVMVVPHRSVTDNVLLGQDGLVRRRVPRGQRRAAAAAALAPITSSLMDLDAPAGRLSLAERQLVVLARALSRNPRILVLDEATAALEFADRETVFRTIESFALSGGLIVFISHRMEEVMRLATRVSVLRSGHLVATLERAEFDADRLLALMAPQALEELRHVG